MVHGDGARGRGAGERKGGLPGIPGHSYGALPHPRWRVAQQRRALLHDVERVRTDAQTLGNEATPAQLPAVLPTKSEPRAGGGARLHSCLCCMHAWRAVCHTASSTPQLPNYSYVPALGAGNMLQVDAQVLMPGLPPKAELALVLGVALLAAHVAVRMVTDNTMTMQITMCNVMLVTALYVLPHSFGRALPANTRTCMAAHHAGRCVCGHVRLSRPCPWPLSPGTFTWTSPWC